MRKLSILFWWCVIGFVVPHSAKSEAIPSLQKETRFIERTLYFDKISSRKLKSAATIEDYDIVELKGTRFITKSGEPMLPIKFYQVLFPPDATLERVEIVSKEEYVVPGSYIVYPSQPPIPISSQEIPAFVSPKKEIYESNTLYPAEVVGNYHTGTLSGYRIGSFSIAPVKYIPAQGELKQITKIKIRIHYLKNNVKVKPIWERHKGLIESQVKGLVMNPDDILRWGPSIRKKATTSKALEEDTIDYVIIAPAADTIYFQPLAYWKTKKGVPAKMVAKEWISANYTGANLQEKIKNFIRDANTTWGAIWFFLGGDGSGESGWMPERGCYGKVYTWVDEQIPCERYWEDLNDNWNRDGDTKYGEKNDGPSGGDIDMYPDIWVGRASVNTASEAKTVVNNILTYEKNPGTGYIENILLCSASMTDDHMGYYTTDSVIKFIPPSYSYDKNDHGQGRDTYPGDQAMIGKMNAGCGFFCTGSHGEYNVIMDATGSSNDITNNNLDAYLNAGNKLGIHTGICCISGKIDANCYAEHLCNHPDGGAVAAIYNSRYGWGNVVPPPLGPTCDLNFWLFEEIFQKDNYKHLGNALATTRDRMVPEAIGFHNEYRWCLFEYNLFGCPEMPIRTLESDMLQVTHDSTVLNTPGNFTVTVKDNDGVTPMDSALVCLWCKEEAGMYARGHTNSLGELSLTVDPTVTDDTMWVTVTAHNYLPYEGLAIVAASGISYREFLAPYSLSQNSPNPFLHSTAISYQLPVKSIVSLKIYDLAGRTVKTLVEKIENHGTKLVIWDRNDDQDEKVSSGIYFYSLKVSVIPFNLHNPLNINLHTFKNTKKLTILH